MKTKQIFIYSAVLVTGLILGYLLFGSSSGEEISQEQHLEEAHTDEAGNIVYFCSMHPQVRQNEPGDCPICGMELIPLNNTGSETASNEYTLTMTPAAVKLAEIGTSPVVREKPAGILKLPGTVEENRNNVSAVTAHFPGRIRSLYVDYKGTYIFKGQRLASFYSPELIAAQQELLETIKYRDQNPRLYNAAREKLRLWEFPESTIREIEENGEVLTELDFYSPVSGYISDIMVDREQHVKEGDMMYKVVNLNNVWVDFHANETNVTDISEGDSLNFRVDALPGRNFKAKVIYIDPFLNQESRSVTIRTKVNNPGAILKPGMLAQATVRTSFSNDEELLIPRSAVLWTGKRSVVYVELPDTEQPSYEAREVELGSRAGDRYVIEAGLTIGERVVTNGTFLLDSEAQLKDKLSMMNRRSESSENGSSGHNANDMIPQNRTESGRAIEVEAGFMEKMQQLITSYLNLKDQVYSGDPDAVRNVASDLNAALNEMDGDGLNRDIRMVWMGVSEKVNRHSYEMAEAGTIEEQRKAFIDLSDTIIEMVKAFQVPGVHYEQYCPMANNGEGAYWLSDLQDIANPYFGDQMHNCGETIEKIEF